MDWMEKLAYDPAAQPRHHRFDELITQHGLNPFDTYPDDSNPRAITPSSHHFQPGLLRLQKPSPFGIHFKKSDSPKAF